MKKFLIGLITLSLLLTMCVPFASAESDDVTIVQNMIDYSVYDSDMVYIQEHADLIAKRNEDFLAQKTRATTYTRWLWQTAPYVKSLGSAWMYEVEYYFQPTRDALYFSIDVMGVSRQPYIALNTLNNDGTLNYIGSYYIDATMTANRYTWDRYESKAVAGQKYVVGLIALTNWSSAEIKIHNTDLYY